MFRMKLASRIGIAAGMSLLICGLAMGETRQPVFIEVEFDDPPAEVELDGWEQPQAGKPWRAAMETGRMTLQLAPGEYHIMVTYYDSNRPEEAATLAVSMNGHSLGKIERGLPEDGRGWTDWRGSIKPEMFTEEGPQKFLFDVPDKPMAVLRIRIADFLPPAAVGNLQRNGWTKACKRFMYPPTVWVDPAEAAKYVVQVQGRGHDASVEVTSDRPELDLTEVWDQLPARKWYYLWVEARDAEGRVVGRTAAQLFHKGESFQPGSYRPAKRSYLEATRDGMECVIGFLDAWKTGNPQMQPKAKYFLPQYHSLFISLYTQMLLQYREQFPQSPQCDDAMAIARSMMDYLIDTRTPADWAYPNMPRTHGRPDLLQIPRTGLAGEQMLRLYEATKDQNYFDAALEVAETLENTQRPDGSWPFWVDPESGKVYREYTSDQIEVICLLTRLIENHSRDEFVEARDKALEWMLTNPVRTMLWQAQYEDVSRTAPYGNLEWHDTMFLIEYLAARATPENGYLEICRKLFRYIEDQFVFWENSFEPLWVCPSVTEQYRYYRAIDGHCALFLRACVALHKVTGEKEYLEKGKAVANTLTIVQRQDGLFPTYIRRVSLPDNPDELGEIDYRGIWHNSTAGTSAYLGRFCAYLQELEEQH